MRARRLVPLLVSVGLLVGPQAPALGHASGSVPVRPFIGGIELAVPGLTASVVFAGAWQVRMSNITGIDLTVLDPGGRPFLRIGPGGVSADCAALSWYQSNSIDGLARPPSGLTADAAADWHLVATEAAWSWFDPRLRPEPGLLRPEVAARNQPVDLRAWSIPMRYGATPGSVNGRLQFEPTRGAYRHALTSPDQPPPGVTVGLLRGFAVPTPTIENKSAQTVTLLGRKREPFVRIAGTGAGATGAIEVNLHSPTWVETAQFLGRSPTVAADLAAPPQWREVSVGGRWSWRDFGNRPPDDEPPADLVRKGRPFPVRQWSVPLLVGDRPVKVTGVGEAPATPLMSNPPRRADVSSLR